MSSAESGEAKPQGPDAPSHRHPGLVSSGVEALIERLREEGVEEGRQRAAAIVADAETRAQWIVAQAKAEAVALEQQAKATAQRTQQATREALATATRDAILALKGELNARFALEVQRLVSQELGKTALLRQMILELVGRVQKAVDAASTLEVLLPRDAVGFEELSRDPDALDRSPLTDAVRTIAQDMLRDGVTLGADPEGKGGLRLHLQDSGVVVDLGEETVGRLLLAHLQPRFRALVEGIVK